MIDGIPVVNIGAGGLLAITVLMILTGRLVPRKNLEDKQAECDAWHKAADEWRGVAEKTQPTLDLVVTMLKSITSHRNGGGE